MATYFGASTSAGDDPDLTLLLVEGRAGDVRVGFRIARLALRIAILLAACALGKQARGGEDRSESVAATYVPTDAVAIAVLCDGAAQADRLRILWDELDIEHSLAFERLSENPQFTQLQVGLTGIAAVARMDVWDLFGVALGREAAIAVVPSGGAGPGVMIAIVPQDAAKFDALVARALRVAGLQPKRDEEEKDDALLPVGEITPIGPGAVVRTKDALLWSNQSALLRRALAVHADKKDRLVDAGWWKDLAIAAPTDAAVLARVDIARLRALTGAGDKLPELLPNPAVGLLLGGAWHTLRNADGAALWAIGDGKTLRIAGRVHAEAALPETHKGFAGAAAGPSWTATELPRYLGEIRVNRRWDALFSDRESYMTVAAAEEFVKFSNTLTTLFGQLDFSGDLLPRINGPVRLVMARQEYSGERTPSPKLPAFALVVPLDLPEKSDLPRRLLSGAQSALSLVNFQQAQNQQASYVIDVDRYKDVRFVYAEYPQESDDDGMMQSGEMKGAASQPGAAQEDGTDATDKRAGGEKPAGKAGAKARGPRGLNIRYNFAPAIAIVKDQFVIATSRKLLENVIDTVLAPAADGAKSGAAAGAARSGAAPATERDADIWTIDLCELDRVLRDNRTELITQRMLEQDQSRARAAADIDAILGLLDFGKRAELSLSRGAAGYALDLAITVQKPTIQPRDNQKPAKDSTKRAAPKAGK